MPTELCNATMLVQEPKATGCKVKDIRELQQSVKELSKNMRTSLSLVLISPFMDSILIPRLYSIEPSFT